MIMKYYVYILICSDGHFYTGYTNNIRKRINQHNGIGFWPGAKYTKGRRPVFLQHLEKFPEKKMAMQREKEIKHLSHDKKQKLISQTTKEQILAAI